jgi:tetratricopeptide (TPR) repeat protein/predicted Ser/Thr protein kinase
VNARVEELFHELADFSPEARNRYFTEHEVDEEIRKEVEALVAADSGASQFLQHDISIAANRALPQLEANGYRCGPYRLLDVIGRGGMAIVYLAERADGEVTQQLAVKLLPAGAGDAHRERFLQERQILSELAHPNIARMLDAGHLNNGRPFLAMEYVDGKPIDLFAAGLSLRQKVGLFLKVCAAVGYLHRNLVVHRDLKPSNILVTAEGEPKLLDFGIAKMLDVATDSTVTSMRMLTPDYASPEQVMGGHVSTATDIYSLGAVLYKLLTGKPAHEFEGHSAEAIAQIVTAREVTRPSKWAAELKGDLEFILLKALRKDPQERYGTAEQFADDLTAFLESHPVKARSGNGWYRTRKFVRRCWVPVAAAAAVIVSLAIGLYVANRQRAIAQRRFQQVRRLANKVVALDDVIKGLPGSTKAREEIVAMSQEYLQALVPDARVDQGLTLEIAVSYATLAKTQGVPVTANLGQYAQAEVGLQKADALLESILKASSRNRQALLVSADVAHARMILASSEHRREDALAQARKAAERLDAFLTLGAVSASEAKTATRLFSNIAMAHKNEHLYADSARYAQRAIEIARSLPSDRPNVAMAISTLADSLRLSGDLDRALESIREARSELERLGIPHDAGTRNNWHGVLFREGLILGQDGNITLERPQEAAAVLQSAFDRAEAWSQADPNDSSIRFRAGESGRELTRILVHTDPQLALAVCDRALRLLGQVKNNTVARREEATLHAAASYALRHLHRSTESQLRIDMAFRLLQETKNYPSVRISPGDEADAVLRAQADQFAAVGQPARAVKVYTELLDKIMAYHPDQENDVGQAKQLSSIYESLASLERRNRQPEEAAALDARRLEIWKHWQTKLPNNPYVLRQVGAAERR